MLGKGEGEPGGDLVEKWYNYNLCVYIEETEEPVPAKFYFIV